MLYMLLIYANEQEWAGYSEAEQAAVSRATKAGMPPRLNWTTTGTVACNAIQYMWSPPCPDGSSLSSRTTPARIDTAAALAF